MQRRESLIFNTIIAVFLTFLAFPQITFCFRISSTFQSYPHSYGDKFNLFSKLTAKDSVELSHLNSRKVFLTGQVDDELAHKITTQLIHLHNLNSSEPIKLYINSPGGSVTAGKSHVLNQSFLVNLKLIQDWPSTI